MSEIMGIAEARARLGEVCRKAGVNRERTGISDHGQLIAVVISPQELADLEDDLALAQNRVNELLGTPEPTSTMDELRQEFAAQDEMTSRHTQGAA
jgi:PHD/YefM family antitoxin component YafN of YafNO toxin-antitoxin module